MYYDINKLTKMLENHAYYLRTGDASKRADLSGANLIYADLRGANLTDADLSGVDLRGARLPINTDLAEDPNG